MFCRGLHGLKGCIICLTSLLFFTKDTNVWLFSGEFLWFLRFFRLTSSRVPSSDGIHRGPSLLEKDVSLYSNGSLCTLQQNFEANTEKQNVNFPGNFSLHIFQHFCMVIQEKINLTGCQEGIPAKVNRCSWRSSAAREAAQAEEPSLQKAVVPQICECLALQMGVT